MFTALWHFTVKINSRLLLLPSLFIVWNHKQNFRICQEWSSELNNNVCGRARAHAKSVETCMQFGVLKNHHTLAKWCWIFMNIGIIIKEISKMHQRIGNSMCAHAHKTWVSMLELISQDTDIQFVDSLSNVWLGYYNVIYPPKFYSKVLQMMS